MVHRLLPDEDVIAIEDVSVDNNVAVNASHVRSSAAGVVASSVDLLSAWWAFVSS